MSTYCSIQEAWNEPSFSKPRKSTPNKMQCGSGGGSSTGNDNNGSPTPNNIYTNQTGNEQAAYMHYAQQHSQQHSQPAKISRTPNQRPVVTPKMVETFMCAGPAAAIPTGSSGMMSQKLDPVTGNIPYASQANDYKYYCDNMGICPKPVMSIEGFTNSPHLQQYQMIQHQSPQSQHSQQYQLIQDQSPQQSLQGCQMPEQSTTYTYPISDLTKQQHEAAMNVYINNGQNGQNGQNSPNDTPHKKQNNSMDNVTGLYDDEISQYMRVQDMGLPYNNSTTAIYDNANFPSHQYPKPPQTSTPQPFDDYHTISNTPKSQPTNNNTLAQAQGKFSTIATGPNTLLYNSPKNTPAPALGPAFAPAPTPAPALEPTPTKEPTSKWQYIMDAVLFIAAGILIIILCDLLFKIAYSVGMRDTFTMLQPYIKDIDELKAKIAKLVPEEMDE